MQTGELAIPQDGALIELSTLARRALHELFEHLPAWMYLLYGCFLLNAELTNYEPPKSDLAHTVVFPLAVFAGYYALRAAFAPDVQYRGAMLLATWGLALGLPALNLAHHRPSPLSIETLRVLYELSNFGWAALLLAHAWRRHKSQAVLFFGAAFVYGACLENGGILLGYFHEENLPLTMTPPLVAPWATMIGWCVVLYMAMFVVWQVRSWLPTLRRSPLASALLAGIVALLLDLQIDPLATASGCWVWDPSLPHWFHGVPLVNFVAWLCAISPFAYVLLRLQQLENISDGGPWTARQLWRLTSWVPGALTFAAAVFGMAIGLAEGFEGPSWTVLFRFVSRFV